MFYLVGSRFFGAHRENSDWDYFGAKTQENREICERMGLKELPPRKSGSLHYWGKYQGRWLDVLLVDDLMHKIYARDALAKLPGVEKLSKVERYQKIREILNAPTAI
jgi:hypothetical protein